MRVVHNGQESSFDPAACDNLADLIGLFTRAVDGERHLPIQISIDGRGVSDDEMSRLELFRLDGEEEVEITSRSCRDVAASTLATTADYAVAVCGAIDVAVSKMRIGSIAEANELCADIADSIGVLALAVSAAGGVIELDAGRISSFDAEINHWLEHVVGSQETGDWVRVADYLEFEVVPILDQLGRYLRSVGAASAAKAGGAVVGSA